MRGVRIFAEAVSDKVLRALDEADACVGNFAAVREISEGFFCCRVSFSDVPARDIKFAVFHGKRETEKFRMGRAFLRYGSLCLGRAFMRYGSLCLGRVLRDVRVFRVFRAFAPVPHDDRVFFRVFVRVKQVQKRFSAALLRLCKHI